MPLDIQSLKEKGVKVPVDFFGDEPVIVVYDPIKVSDPAFRSEYNKKSRELQDGINDWVRSLAPQDAEDGAEGDEVEADEPQPAPDSIELSRRIWEMRGELVEMLLKDWEIESGGKHLAVKAELFTDGTLPPELAAAITQAVWDDVRSLGGNRKPSSSTR